LLPGDVTCLGRHESSRSGGRRGGKQRSSSGSRVRFGGPANVPEDVFKNGWLMRQVASKPEVVPTAGSVLGTWFLAYDENPPNRPFRD
jgi:hypothetical protein